MSKSLKLFTAYKSMDEAVEGLREFVLAPRRGSHNWAVVVVQDGEFRLYERRDQPCYGEMRTYAQGEYRPSDLHHPFPDGVPVLYGAPFPVGGSDTWDDEVSPDTTGDSVKSINMAKTSKCVWMLTSQHSPWREFRDKVELLKNKRGTYKGFILLDTKVSSDKLVSMMFEMRAALSTDKLFAEEDDPAKKLALFFLGRHIVSAYVSKGQSPKFVYQDYGGHFNSSVNRLLSGKPDVIEGEAGTFFARYPYRRPVIEQIWGTSVGVSAAEDSVPHICELSVPKDKFSVDVDLPVVVDKLAKYISNNKEFKVAA